MRNHSADFMAINDAVAPAMHRNAGEKDTFKVIGRVKAEVFGPDGELKAVEETDNLILTVGKNMIADRLLASPTLGVPTHIGVGTSGTAPAAGDTTITGETRVALTSKTRSTNVVTYVGDWAAGSATGTLQETGLWDASSAGNLVGRATFTSIVKGASDTLKVTWTWTIS
jgi:hypothetical protein